MARDVAVADVWVHAGLRRAVVVRWTAAAALLDSEPYSNRGVHVIHLRRRTIASIDVHEDSRAVARALHRQALGGPTEASAAPSIS